MSQFNIPSACICQFKGMEMENKEEECTPRDEKNFCHAKKKKKSQRSNSWFFLRWNLNFT